MNCRNKPELRERLAAEYALGTLRGRARERLQHWLRDDTELAAEVARWEARLAPLAGAVQPVAPPARVWAKIERRLSPRKPFSFWKALGLVASGAATGGMIPKLQSITTLLRRGVHSAHIISGTNRNALLSEVFTDKGTGTMIVA